MITTKGFSVTQGGADTATEAAISTGLMPGASYSAWELLGIEAILDPTLVKAWAAADSEVTLQVTTRSLTGAVAAIQTFDDNDLVASVNLAGIYTAAAAGTTLIYLDCNLTVSLPAPVVVYASEVYVQLISAGTGQANVCWGRFIYNGVTLSKDEAFALVAGKM